jgi:hypothetical protein
MACTAIAAAHGLINGEHVRILREAMGRIPSAIDATTRGQIEADLVRTAMGVGPKELKDTADRTLFLLDQDGPAPDDAERGRRRGVRKAPQLPDGMTPITANLTPEAWAVYEAIFAKWAAPGMCNPAEEYPCMSGTPTQEQIDHDHRTLAQRQHDALLAVGRRVLASGELGQLGLAGRDTDHYLAVFDTASGSALNLLRARRGASPAQRIMLIARDGGCTKPGCTVPAYGSQVHHAARDLPAGLDHPDQCRERRRMDPTGAPRHRPSPHQRLPPPRTPPPATR